MRNLSILFSFILLVFNNVKAQTYKTDTILNQCFSKETDIYFSAALNAVYHQDKMFSAPTYNGLGADVRIGFQKRKINSISQLQFSFGSAILYNNLQALHNYAQYYNFSSLFQKVYHINKYKGKKNSIYLGWQLYQSGIFNVNKQLQNSALAYAFYFSTSPIFRAERILNLNNKQIFFLKKNYPLRLSYHASFPLCSYLSRPNYNGISHMVDGTGNILQYTIVNDMVKNFKVYTLNRFIAFDNKVELQYIMKNNNKWSLQYSWAFQAFNKPYYQYRNVYSGVFISFYGNLKSLE